MKFTLRQLEVFVAVAQQESVSRAAEGLSLSQSATSTSLGELEQQFDCKLFDRAGKRLTLNALGRQLLPQAVALLDRGEEIENLLNGKTAFGSLDLGATLTIGNYLATLLIGAFMRASRTAGCACTNTAQVVSVAHYELDLGLIGGDCRHPDIEVQPWMEDELVVFCAPSIPLARRGGADLERLTREAWILREQGSGPLLTFDQAMRHHPRPLNIRLELEHTEAIKRAVESGPGHRLHFPPGPARRFPPRQPGAGRNARPGPAPAVLLHLAQSRSTRPRPCASSSTCAAADRRDQPQRRDRAAADSLTQLCQGQVAVAVLAVRGIGQREVSITPTARSQGPAPRGCRRLAPAPPATRSSR